MYNSKEGKDLFYAFSNVLLKEGLLKIPKNLVEKKIKIISSFFIYMYDLFVKKKTEKDVIKEKENFVIIKDYV